MRRFLATSTAVGLFLLGPGVSEAHAYIDPGTGSSLIASLGVLLGIMTAVCAVGLAQLKRLATWCIGRFTPARKEEPLTPELAARDNKG
jgi:hypothetical protein